MATLHARPGDVQGFKVAIAAAAAATELNFVAKGDVKAGAYGSSKVELVVGEGVALSEPNAAARLLGGAALAPTTQQAQINHWVEFEESTLRRATLAGGAALSEALTVVEAAVKGGKTSLVGDALTLADVVVYCTLLPVADAEGGDALKAYMKAMGARECVTSSLKLCLGNSTLDAVTDVFNADSSVLKASVPKAPTKGERNILITSALPYVNNVPHLGNIIGCVLSADCYARFCRARGYNTVYICGTDEYGTATETKALSEGLTCAQICDKYHAIHAGIYEWFDCAFDRFGRTPTRHQTDLCQHIFEAADAAGKLQENEMTQLYSEALGKFLADRFVEGTCPKCGYDDARGDQCDSCGSLLNPTELKQPRCKVTGTTPVERQTRHTFLDLPELAPKLQAYIDDASSKGGWSHNCLRVTQAWMRDGLKQRCITRDLKWGTPVPRPGYEDKVFYVWFDAPIGYISITAGYTPDWAAWWQNPEDVELVQFMGKDNVPFHTVIFPATLCATEQPWTMMQNISVTEYLNYEGGKFSKSRGVGVFGNDAADTGIPVEVWRYYLLSNRPENNDTDFQWSDLAAKNNGELLANFGNFVNRALSFTFSRFGGAVPGVLSEAGKESLDKLGAAVAPLVQAYIDALEARKIRDAIFQAMMVSKAGNGFLQDNAPWACFKKDPVEAGNYVTAAVGLVRILASLMQPYMPSISAKILTYLNLTTDAHALDDALLQAAAAPHTAVAAGHKIQKPEVLFREIKEEEVEELRARFSGSQAERAAGAPEAAKAKGGDAKADKKGGKEAKKGGDAKGGKKGGDKAAPAKKAPAKDAPVDVSRLDLRVGHIVKAWKHPESEKLYVEEVDLGEGKPRQVLSGLQQFIPEADMQNRRVAVVCNLKPAKMAGLLSEAMVLAATSADGKTVKLLTPPADAPIGERITFEGFEGEADEVLKPKQKVFDQVHPEFGINADKVATYKGVAFMTSKGAVTADMPADGTTIR